jgi:DNA-binding NarL/FixJ family response regulator
MPTPRLRVLIADDHVPTRTALRADLEEGGIEVCAEAGTGAQAIDAALSIRPDVCPIDMRMPDDGGIIATEVIRQALPSAKIVLMTATPDAEGALAAARTGADGYLTKTWTAADCRRLSRRSRPVRPPTRGGSRTRCCKRSGKRTRSVQETERPTILRSRKNAIG